jgi:hypothetical protein
MFYLCRIPLCEKFGGVETGLLCYHNVSHNQEPHTQKRVLPAAIPFYANIYRADGHWLVKQLQTPLPRS